MPPDDGNLHWKLARRWRGAGTNGGVPVCRGDGTLVVKRVQRVGVRQRQGRETSWRQHRITGRRVWLLVERQRVPTRSRIASYEAAHSWVCVPVSSVHVQ